VDIVTRAEWGARPPKRRHFIDTPTPRLWLHHTAGALDAGGNGVWWDDVRGIQDFHMDVRGWSDIAYSFLVGGGMVFEGRGVGIAGGHTAGENTESHAICLIGNYEFMHPTDADLQAIADLTRHGLEHGWWADDITGPHKAAPGASTACCGRHLIAKIPDIRRMADEPQAPPKPSPEPEADMIWHIEGSPYTFLHLGGRDFLPLTEANFWKLAGQGVKVVSVTNAFFQSKLPTDGQGSLIFGATYHKAP
jgi:hypothetical protein